MAFMQWSRVYSFALLRDANRQHYLNRADLAMGQLFSVFRRKRENDDFETILNELDNSIRVKEENLAFIRQRERRAIVLFTSYSILIWALYALVWWFGFLDGSFSVHTGEEEGGGWTRVEEDIGARIVKTLPVGAIPILIFFTRRIVKAWYRRKQEAENKQLTSLRKKQTDQIDKLKKLSNYDKITEMLERHGQAMPRSASGMFPPGTPIKQQQQAGGGPPGSAYSTPIGGQRAPPFGPGGMPLPGGTLTPAQQRAMSHQKQHKQQHQGGQGPKSGNGQGAAGPQGKKIFPAPPGPNAALPPGFAADLDEITPPHQPRSFIDKVADALLGGDEQSPASKYALICQKCFAHNGLVMKDEVMDVQFVCPKCGHFNPSRRARKTGQTSLVQQQQAPATLSRPSSRTSQHQASSELRHGRSSLGLSGQTLADLDGDANNADEDDGNNNGDDSLLLSSPTTLHSPLPTSGGTLSGQDINDVSMEEDDRDGQEEHDVEEKPTATMNADERKENLRRRTSRKEGRGQGKE